MDRQPRHSFADRGQAKTYLIFPKGRAFDVAAPPLPTSGRHCGRLPPGRRAIDAGDGIEIHAANGYLLTSFAQRQQPARTPAAAASTTAPACC
jgi:hypothetical protein